MFNSAMTLCTGLGYTSSCSDSDLEILLNTIKTVPLCLYSHYMYVSSFHVVWFK